jgi:tetratricopeptide (TPR) repeat protein
MPTQIDQKSLTQNIEYDKDNKNKLYEINNTQKQITSLLQEVDNIGKKEGTQPIEVIRSEGIQISRKELLLKEHILKGNEYYYKKEYNNAIQCFDKALEIDPNNASTWNNKGLVLDHLRKYDDAIQCYDKALEIDPNNDLFNENRNIVLEKLGKTEKKSGWKRFLGR